MSASELLSTLLDAGLLTDIDRQFALLMAELGAEDDIALPAAVASAAQRAGHTCLPLSECAGRRLAELRHWLPMGASAEAALDASAASARLPTNLSAVLGRSPLVADGATEELRPLVVDAGRLYLQRLFQAECKVAHRLRTLASSENAPSGDLAATLQALFADAGQPALQAARTIATRRLCVVTGGPGTGKTTLAARLIALLTALKLATPRRIALAAPTGKAAARLQESLAAQLGELASSVPALGSFSPQAATVHRLLLRGSPAPFDALLIDECSMVDLSLMKRVVDALPQHARLILLGDSSQLGSVQPGCVFGDLIAAASAASSPLSSCVVRLVESHRFRRQSGLGSLAEAIVEGDAERTLAVLRRSEDADVQRQPLADPADFDALAERYAVEHCAPLLRQWRKRDGSASLDGLSAFPALRVLCAHRLGAFGAARFNQLVEHRLRETNLLPKDEEFYLGRPLIVTRNDPSSGLSNGDTGVVVNGEGGVRQVWFPDLAGPEADAPFLIPPLRLPPHESFFALTVHRAQGSEYDEVAFVPGPAGSLVNNRELLYTAVTRARRKVAIHASTASVSASVRRTTARTSGLTDRLSGAVPLAASI